MDAGIGRTNLGHLTSIDNMYGISGQSALVPTTSAVPGFAVSFFQQCEPLDYTIQRSLAYSDQVSVSPPNRPAFPAVQSSVRQNGSWIPQTLASYMYPSVSTGQTVVSQLPPIMSDFAVPNVLLPALQTGVMNQTEQRTQLCKDKNHPFYWRRRASYAPAEGMTRTKDKYRVVYTEKQRLGLEKEFKNNKFITMKRKSELSNELDLSERQIKIWFQNRRAKERRQRKKDVNENTSVEVLVTENDSDDGTMFGNEEYVSPTNSSCRFSSAPLPTYINERDLFNKSQCRYQRTTDISSHQMEKKDGNNGILGFPVSPSEWNTSNTNTLVPLNVSPFMANPDMNFVIRT